MPATRTVFSNLGSMTASLFTLPLIWMFAGASDANSFNAVDNAAKAVGYRNTNIILAIRPSAMVATVGLATRNKIK